MNILVFNCGSSSLTYKIFRVDNKNNPVPILEGKAHRVGVKGTKPSFIEYKFKNKKSKETIPLENHKKAASAVIKFIKEKGIIVDYIGHRFVHGGSKFSKPVFVDEKVIEDLKACFPLAPVHNPIDVSVINECQKAFPNKPQFVTFDNAFHSSIPYYAYSYLLPKDIIKKYGFRKYGFHGLSYSYVIRAGSHFLKKQLNELKIVACHLGTGGSSVCAFKGGHSVDTSMGYSPLTGLIMSTRCGDIDPMLTIYLMAVFDYKGEELLKILNKKSGLLGISEISSDLRDIIETVSKNEGNQSTLALNMYIYRLKKYIGSYIAILNGIDLLIFTDDIGVTSSLVREKVCENMAWAGIIIDKKLNKKNINTPTVINDKTSKVKILVIPTNEELAICMDGIRLIKEK